MEINYMIKNVKEVNKEKSKPMKLKYKGGV